MSERESLLEGEFQWFWAEDLDTIEQYLKPRYGSGHFIDHVHGTDFIQIGNTYPTDATNHAEENPEPVIQFKSLTYYTAPLFQGNGYYVTRLPPRSLMAQYFREEKAGLSIFQNGLHNHEQKNSSNID